MQLVQSRRNFLVGAASVMAAATVHGADDSRPIRLIVPTPPASASDTLARALTAAWGSQSGRPVVVENVSGAGGLIGTTQLIRAPKDGLTLELISSNHTMNPWLFKKMPYDALQDITPICMIGSVPMMLVASPALQVETAAELVKTANSRSQELNEGVVPGTVYQIASEVFKDQAKIKTNRISYKGTAQMVTDILAGVIDIAFISAQLAMPHIKAGKLKGIAVTTAQRSNIAPQVPTFIEAGFPHYSADAWLAIVGPAGLGAAEVQARRKEIESSLADPAVKKAIDLQGLQITDMSTSQILPFLKADLDRNRILIQRVGITLD